MSTTTTPAGVELVERIRAVLMRNDHFRQSPLRQQEAMVQARARETVLAAAPIGQKVTAVDTALESLIEAVEAFLEEYPSGAATIAAAASAIDGAGLEPRDPHFIEFGWEAGEFKHLPAELRGWLFMLNVMAERMFEVAPKTHGVEDLV